MTLQISKAIADHPVLALASSTGAVLSVALGIVGWLHQERIAYVTAKYEAEMSSLRARLDRAELAARSDTTRSTSIEKASASVVLRDTPSAGGESKTPPISPAVSPPSPTTSIQPPTIQLDVFTKAQPYPTANSSAKLGVRLSTLKTMYPQGAVQSWGFDVPLQQGPFEEVTYWMSDEVDNPPASRITFKPRDESARKAVWASATTSFQGIRQTSVRGGTKLVWRFTGITATLDDDGYHLERDVR